MNKVFRLILPVLIICFFLVGVRVRAQNFQRKNGGQPGFKRFGKRQNTNRQNIFDRFFAIDRDGNKILEPKEINRIRRLGAVKRLKMFDVDSNGSISYQEVVDFVISKRKNGLNKVSNKIKQKLIEKISNSSNPQKAEQNFSWLKSKENIFSILDRDQNKKIDKSEIDAAMPDLLALVYSKRITQLSKLIEQSPSKEKDKRRRLIARLMDYNADDLISVSEFDRFLYKHVDKKVADQYALSNKASDSQKSSVAVDKSNYILEKLRKEAHKSSDKVEEKKGNNNFSQTVKTQKQTQKKADNQKKSEFVEKKPQETENFIIPVLKNFEDEIEEDQDPLVDLLGAGADEELLW